MAFLVLLSEVSLRGKADVVGYYFDNLLPDSQGIRERIQARFGTRSVGTFDLLEAIGRDCVGAIQLTHWKTVPLHGAPHNAG